MPTPKPLRKAIKREETAHRKHGSTPSSIEKFKEQNKSSVKMAKQKGPEAMKLLKNTYKKK